MTRKEYLKPTTRTVKLKHRVTILSASVDAYGMNGQLQGTNNEQEQVVDEAW